MKTVLQVFDPASGRIIETRGAASIVDALTSADPAAGTIVGPGRSTSHYVDLTGAEAVLAERAPLAASWDKTAILDDGIDAATLSGLPVPCTVTVDGTPHAVDDGVFVFRAADPGIYRIEVDEPSFLPANWTIEAGP